MTRVLEPLNVFLRGVRLQPRRSFVRWLTEEVVIPEGPMKGTLYSLDNSGFLWVEPVVTRMEQYKHCTLQACPRTGKSLPSCAKTLWRVCEYGDSAQILAQDETTSVGFWKTTVEPILTENPRLRALLPSDYKPRDKSRPLVKFLNGGTIRNIYNARSIKSYDASVLHATEAGAYKETSGNETHILTLAKRRQDRHPHGGYWIIESSPSNEKSKLEEAFLAGTQTELYINCPHCGQAVLAGEREGVQGWKDADSIEDVIGVFVCRHCQTVISEEQRAALRPHLVDKAPAAPEFSVRINWWWTDRTIQEMAEYEWSFQAAPDLDKYRNLMQNNYACCTTAAGELKALQADLVSARFTKEHLLERRSSAYRKGEIPPTVTRITAAIDVQKKWGYYVVLGHDDRNNAVYVIDWGIIEIVPRELQDTTDATSEMVVEALDATYQRLRSDYRPKTIWVDINYKHPSSTRNIIEEWSLRKGDVRAVRGRGGVSSEKLQNGLELPPRVAALAHVYVGKEYGENVWFLNADLIKEDMNARTMYPLNRCGLWLPPEIIEGKNRANYLVQHMLAEAREVRRDKFGNQRVSWTNKSKSRNDLWDCITYAYFGLLLELAIDAIRQQRKKRRKTAEDPPANAPSSAVDVAAAPASAPDREQQARRPRRKAVRRSTGFRF